MTRRTRGLGRRLVAALAIAAAPVLLAGPAAASPASEPASKGGDAPAPSAPSDREIAAIEAEIARGLGELRLGESPTCGDDDDDDDDGCDGKAAPAPYYVAVRLVRAELLSLDGSYGGIITDVGERQAVASVEVRVGSAARDNGGIFGQDGAQVRLLLPLGPSPVVTRKKLWLAMDQAYRDAAVTYAAKQAILARLAGDPPPPDFGPPPETVPRIRERAQPVAGAVDRPGLRQLVADLSARFAEHPEIDNGDVFFQLLRSEITTITSEGTVLRESRDRAVLSVVADTRAADGMQLDHGRAIHFQAVPKADDALRKDGEALVDQVLAELAELAAAPMIDEDYDGPVLFADAAAPQLLATTVATQAIGKPAPLSDGGRLRDLEPHWQDDLGKTVMPDFVDVVDDPRSDGFGQYLYDAEGYLAAPVSLVRRGVLENLIMTREPNKHVGESNGHARQSPILTMGPAISNLRLSARTRGRTRVALERDLLRRAREDGYDFAYTVELLRDGSVLGPVPREGASTYGGSRKVTLPVPARVYRVEPGGKRTLVRGAVLAPASMRVLRRIRAVGNRRNDERMRIPVGTMGGFAAETGMDGILSHTVDVEVSSPDLLVEGLEILIERGEHERLPTLVHPLRDASWSADVGEPAKPVPLPRD
ncbi:MAG: metallopeptidase TldD-related protein [Nannocystaceae bacterium]